MVTDITESDGLMFGGHPRAGLNVAVRFASAKQVRGEGGPGWNGLFIENFWHMIFHCILIIYYCYCYHYNCIILYLYYIYISVYIYISIHIPLCPGKVFVYCNLDPDVGHQKFGYSLGEDHFNFALVQKLEPPGFLEKRRKFALKWGMESWSLTADVSLVCFCTIQDLSNWKYWIGLWFVDLQTELSDCQSPMRCRWPDERTLTAEASDFVQVSAVEREGNTFQNCWEWRIWVAKTQWEFGLAWFQYILAVHVSCQT